VTSSVRVSGVVGDIDIARSGLLQTDTVCADAENSDQPELWQFFKPVVIKGL